MNINYTEEFDKSLTEEQKKGLKRFLIFRYNPDDKNDRPKYMSYYINPALSGKMYLDALLYIKDNFDSTLSFRR